MKVLYNMQNIIGLEESEIPKRNLGTSNTKNSKRSGNYPSKGGNNFRQEKQTSHHPQLNRQAPQFSAARISDQPRPVFPGYYHPYMYHPMQYHQQMAYMAYAQQPQMAFPQQTMPSRNSMMANRGSNFQVPMMVVPNLSEAPQDPNQSQHQYYGGANSRGGGGINMNVNLSVNLNYSNDQTSIQPQSAGMPPQSSKRARMGSLQVTHRGPL